MNQITFNDMPDAISELLNRVTVMSSQLSAMTRKVEQLESKLSHDGEALVCGRFQRGEYIAMSDARLWEGVGAPFSSRYQVKESRKYGCKWVANGTNKTYKIKAEALAEYLNGSKR